MTRAKIDQNSLKLIMAIAGTRDARVSAMALDQHRGATKQLLDAGFMVRRGSTMAGVAEDDLDDALVRLVDHPIHGRFGQLGNTAWQDEDDSAVRRIYAMDMLAVARRALGRIECSLVAAPVPHLDGSVLDFGSARLPRRKKRVGMWLARGLTTPRRFEALRDLAGRRPADGLRVVIALDPGARLRPSYLRGHEIVALEDVVDHEDGLAVHPEILSARLLNGPSRKGPVWVSGDGGVLIVHGKWHEFAGPKQKTAVRVLAEAYLDGDAIIPVTRVLTEAECGNSVRRLKDLFSGHRTWHEVITESGSSCWLEV